MKQYPSFDGQIVDIPIFAFAKLDGSQLRAEWTRKNGLTKFGSKGGLIGEDHLHLGDAISIAQKTYAEGLGKVFRDARLDFVTCYFEFWGAKTFAGRHDPDDPHFVTLFDVAPHKKGILPPREFLDLVGGKVPHADLLYTGKPNRDFIQSVKESTLEGMPEEGVVCKGKPVKNGYPPTMFKVKSHIWIDKVHALYGNDPKLLAELL